MADNIDAKNLADHELIQTLKNEIDQITDREDRLEKQLIETQANYGEASEQLALHEKLTAQHQILKLFLDF